MIYIYSLTYGKLTQYADDIAICFNSKSKTDLEMESNEDLNCCVQRFLELNLKTNIKKSNYINFVTSSSVPTGIPLVMIGEEILTELVSTKFLGLYIDSGLTWKSHVEHLCSKISSKLYLLRYLSSYCTFQIMLTSYYGLIFPYLNYGIALWGSCSKKDFQRLFVIQKKVLRIVGKINSRESCKPLFQQNNILTLPSIYILETCTFAKFKSKLIIGSEYHNHDTRFKNNFRTNQHNLKLFEGLPNEIGSKILNTLPHNLKNENAPMKFRKKLKSYLLKKIYYKIEDIFQED
jgi:hypothetical protein